MSPTVFPGSRRTLLTLAVAAAGLSAVDGSWAQTRSTVLEEIIVTAQRTEESIQETPISMAAFGSDQLRQIGAFEAHSVANYSPNVRIQRTTGSDDNYSMSIRGLSASEPSLTTEPVVGLYMDGVYIARNAGAAFDIVDLERIEVLRGPQGTLFGRNTIGGALNIITEKPRGEFALKQMASVGNRGYVRSQTTIDLPKVGDFALKLSHMYNKKNSAFKSLYTGQRLEGPKAQAYRLALRWTPLDELTVDLTYDRSERDTLPIQQMSHMRDWTVGLGGTAYAQAQALASPHRKSHLPVIGHKRDSYSNIDGTALTAEWAPHENLTLKSITGYREWSSAGRRTDFGHIVADGSTVWNYTGDSIPAPYSAGERVPIFLASRDSGQRQFTQEFQAVGDTLDDRLRYNVGLYYFQEKAREVNPQTLMLPLTAILRLSPEDADYMANVGQAGLIHQPHFAYGTDNRSWAAYGQFTYAATDALDVILGMRYSADKKKAWLRQDFDDVGLTTLKDSDSWSNFSPSLTLSYNWADGVNVYAKVGRGYRAGGYNARATTEETFRSPVDEEKVLAYELGIKSDWFDRSLRLNAAYFQMKYTDRQVTQFTATGAGASAAVVNAGKSINQGVELDLTWLPLPGLQLALNYGYLDVNYRSFKTGLLDPVTGLQVRDNANNPVVMDISRIASEAYYAPRHSGSFVAQYALEPWSWGQLTLRADTIYVDKITNHPQMYLYDNKKAHQLFNARATLSEIAIGREGRLSISAWGHNLENKRYREFGIDFGQLGFAVNSYGELRSYGLDFIYEYGR